MIEIIAGAKGKGKTKHLLDRVSRDLQEQTGSLIFVDKDSSKMLGLPHQIRLIDMSEYAMESTDEFLGFLCGVISTDHDISEIFLDSFLTIGFIDTDNGLTDAFERLGELSERFDTDFILSISKNASDLPPDLRDSVILSL